MERNSAEWISGQEQGNASWGILRSQCHPSSPAIRITRFSDKYVCGHYDTHTRSYCGAFVRNLKPWEKEGVEPDKTAEAPKPAVPAPTSGKVASHGYDRIDKLAGNAYQPESEEWDAEPFDVGDLP